MYSIRCLTILFLFVALQAQSQNTETYKYPPSEILTIHSKILNENRKIYVHCPKLDSADLNPTFPTVFFKKCIYALLAKRRNLKRQSRLIFVENQ